MIFLEIRRVLTCWNMIPTGHRAIMVRTPTKQLIHIAAPLGDNWEANQTSVPIKLYSAFDYFQEDVANWMMQMLRCLFLSPWKMMAQQLLGFAWGNCTVPTRELPQCSHQQAQTCQSVQPGKVTNDTTCQSDPGSTWDGSAPHESVLSMTAQRDHLFYYHGTTTTNYYFLSELSKRCNFLADTDVSIILLLT